MGCPHRHEIPPVLPTPPVSAALQAGAQAAARMAPPSELTQTHEATYIHTTRQPKEREKLSTLFLLHLETEIWKPRGNTHHSLTESVMLPAGEELAGRQEQAPTKALAEAPAWT